MTDIKTTAIIWQIFPSSSDCICTCSRLRCKQYQQVYRLPYFILWMPPVFLIIQRLPRSSCVPSHSGDSVTVAVFTPRITDSPSQIRLFCTLFFPIFVIASFVTDASWRLNWARLNLVDRLSCKCFLNPYSYSFPILSLNNPNSFAFSQWVAALIILVVMPVSNRLLGQKLSSFSFFSCLWSQ